MAVDAAVAGFRCGAGVPVTAFGRARHVVGLADPAVGPLRSDKAAEHQGRRRKACWIPGGMVSVLLHLRQGYEPAPFFDRRARAAYALTLGALVVGTALFFGSGFSFTSALAVVPSLWATILVAGLLARRARYDRLATGFETTAIVYGQGIAFMLVIYALMALPIPLVDHQLAAADKALGFYWPDLAAPFRQSDRLTYAGKVIYSSFVWQPALVTVSLAVAGMHERAWKFVTAATISLGLASIIGPLFPADTAVVYYHVPEWPNLKSALNASEEIHAVKGGHPMIDGSKKNRLLTFPRYTPRSAIPLPWELFSL